MPNWCSTVFAFRGEKNEIKVFYEKINEWTSKEFTKTDFGDVWLGNILYGAGLQDRIDNNDPELFLRCRGHIDDISEIEEHEDYACFYVYTETAWVPMAKMWEETIKALELNIKFAFRAEECGCELYWIYDPDNLGEFSDDEVYIDTWYDGNDLEIERKFCDLGGYYSSEGAISALDDFFGTNVNNLEQLIEMADGYPEDDDDTYISVHQFKDIDAAYD